MVTIRHRVHKYPTMPCQSIFRALYAIRLAIPFLLLSCKSPASADPEKGVPVQAPGDTLVIGEPAAVFFTANSTRREALKKQLGDQPFDGVDHECFYQMKNARTSLQEHWPHIRIYELKDTLVLRFVRRDGQVRFVDLQSRKDLCGLYLFNPGKDPVPGDMMNIGTSLETCFLR